MLTTNVGLVLWVTGVSLSLSLAITYFGLVVALGTLLGCRWFARVERRRAGIVLGAPIAERYAPHEDARWTTRLHTLIGDPTTWRDFAWTGLSGVVGMTLSGLAGTLWGCVLGSSRCRRGTGRCPRAPTSGSRTWTRCRSPWPRRPSDWPSCRSRATSCAG